MRAQGKAPAGVPGQLQGDRAEGGTTRRATAIVAPSETGRNQDELMRALLGLVDALSAEVESWRALAWATSEPAREHYEHQTMLRSINSRFWRKAVEQARDAR